MKSVFMFKNKEKKKGNKSSVYCAIGISLAVVVSNVLPPDGFAVHASGGTTELYKHRTEYTTENNYAETSSITGRNATRAAAEITAPLDFSNATGDQGSLDSDGYHWNNSSKTLTLKNVYINSTVTLPNDTVTIKTEGNCSIKELNVSGYPDKTHLIFSGPGKLTIEKQINISGGNNNLLSVAKGAYVVAENGISIGASSGVDSIVTVNGSLTVKSGADSNAIYAGKVIVSADGLLEVSGEEGVRLNGMTKNGSDKDFSGAFTIEKGGCFTANCNIFNVRVDSGTGNFPDGSNAAQAISVPENYLPTDCGVKQSGGEINFIKKSTGNIYTGALTIHENHSWSPYWCRNETGHWKECTLEGCDKTDGYSVHSYDNNSWECTACGAKMDVTLNGAEGLTYNGQEHKPGVTVIVARTTLDPSKYDISYNNNINAGEASVIVKGKGDLTFERTEEFLIAKTVPAITWGSAMQTVTYSGSQPTIIPPSVTLANGENFGGEISYSYALSGSADYTADMPVNAGTYTVKAHIAEQDNYTAADSTNILTLTIEQAENAPNMPSGFMNVAKRCEKVSDVELPEDWQWQDKDTNTALEIGVPVTVTAVYTGADKNNYKNITTAVVITRSNCDHENTELRNVVASTCQQKGYSGDTYCLDCGELLTKGTETALADHSGGTATCISGKICVVCGTEYTAKDSRVHIHTEIRGRKNATCISDGYTGDTYCTDCKTKISSGRAIPATGHNWQVTSEEKPTYSENGSITYTCSRCGDTYTKLVDKLKNTTSRLNNGLSKAVPANQEKQERRSPQTGEP